MTPPDHPLKYTSIVYFHGIGTPKRYEEISRLADAFDQFAQSQEIGSVGRLRQIEVKWEKARNNGDDVAFISATRVVHRFRDRKGFKTNGAFYREGSYRIYEGYWSSATAGGFSATRVLLWLLSNFLNPFLVLLRPWRTNTRLKLTALHRMFAERPKSEQLEGILEVLESHYRSFESWPARRQYRKGTFSEFLRFATSHTRDKRSVRDEISQIAIDWRRRFVLEQIAVALFGVTSLLAAFELLLLSLLVACSVISYFNSELATYLELSRYAVSVPLPYLTLPVLLVLWGTLLWQTRSYLSYFVADVMFWSTTIEKDLRFARRKEILDSAETLLEHVVLDPNCKRVVVIGHSLGSAIAFQGLISLGRKLLAREDGDSSAPSAPSALSKIEQLITVGSPIDRIHYFFELYDSEHHRFNRIMDDVQGSTSDAPFSLKETKGANWTNIWDDTDPISSPLFSPIKRSRDSGKILNLLTRSTFRSNPIAAHSNYFLSQTALRTVFWISIFGRIPKTMTSNMPSWAATLLRLSPRMFVWLIAANIWLALLFVLNILSGWWLLIPAGLLLITWIVARTCDSRWPLRLDKSSPSKLENLDRAH